MCWGFRRELVMEWFRKQDVAGRRFVEIERDEICECSCAVWRFLDDVALLALLRSIDCCVFEV